MSHDTPAPDFRSSLPYEATRINAAAVYCSDGRVGDHIDEFLHQGLGLPRYDRVACPGGPVALAGRLRAFWESRGVEDQLRFLARVHELQQVLLIAHAGCAFYGERLGFAPAEAEAEQRADLLAAASVVERIGAGLEVAGYFAHVAGNEIWFERVFASETLDARLRRRAPPTQPPAPRGPTRPATSRPPGQR